MRFFFFAILLLLFSSCKSNLRNSTISDVVFDTNESEKTYSFKKEGDKIYAGNCPDKFEELDSSEDECFKDITSWVDSKQLTDAISGDLKENIISANNMVEKALKKSQEFDQNYETLKKSLSEDGTLSEDEKNEILSTLEKKSLALKVTLNDKKTQRTEAIENSDQLTEYFHKLKTVLALPQTIPLAHSSVLKSYPVKLKKLAESLVIEHFNILDSKIDFERSKKLFDVIDGVTISQLSATSEKKVALELSGFLSKETYSLALYYEGKRCNIHGIPKEINTGDKIDFQHFSYSDSIEFFNRLNNYRDRPIQFDHSSTYFRFRLNASQPANNNAKYNGFMSCSRYITGEEFLKMFKEAGFSIEGEIERL